MMIKKVMDARRNPTHIIEDFHCLNLLNGHPQLQQKLWMLALQWLEAEGANIPWALVGNYRDFRKYLRANGITHTRRVPHIMTALKIAYNNRNLKRLGKSRPLAVVVGNVSDYNGAFTVRKGYAMLQTLLSQGYDVVYVESSRDKEVMTQLQRIKNATGRRIDCLILAGHGDKHTLRLGDTNKITKAGGQSEDAFLDVGDVTWQQDFAGLERVIATKGQVVLWACSNGTLAVRNNLMKAVAMRLPGRDIFGAKIDSNIKRMMFTGKGRNRRIQGILWHRQAGRRMTLSPAQVRQQMPAFKRWVSWLRRRNQDGTQQVVPAQAVPMSKL